MSVRSRVAFASGVAGLAGAALLLSGRFDGSIVAALLFVFAARVAVPASVADVRSSASSALSRHASFAPAWALIAAAGIVRAGSASIADARGANAIAGLAVARGSVLTVAGVWFAVAAGLVVIASRSSIRGESTEDPVSLQRLEIGAVIAQAALLVTLFAGPHVTEALDAVSWVAGIGALGAIAWVARDKKVTSAPVVAAVLSAVGLALTLAGGAP